MRTLQRLSITAVLASAAALVAVPATVEAQRQGAIEIGGFGRFTKFMDTLQLDNGLGLGARGGMYIFRNWLLEAELSYADVDVTAPLTGQRGLDTLNTVSHALWAYRLTYNLPLANRAKLLLGGGYAYDSYGRVRRVAPRGGGPQGLVGLRLVLNDRLSLRFEGTGTYIVPADEDTRPVGRATGLNLGAQGGLSVSFFTQDPKPRIQYDTVTIVQRDTQFVTRIDTVRAGPAAGGAASAARPVVIGAINFAFNKSDITDEAKAILDKIATTLTDPTNVSRTIDVTGNTDAIGSEGANIRLGQDRADQAKAYLVSKGVAESRINARTAGESDPIAPNTTDNGRATNRRVLIMLTN